MTKPKPDPWTEPVIPVTQPVPLVATESFTPEDAPVPHSHMDEH